MRKRMRSLLVALVMALTLLPTTALAVTPPTPTGVQMKMGENERSTIPCLYWENNEDYRYLTQLVDKEEDNCWYETSGSPRDNYSKIPHWMDMEGEENPVFTFGKIRVAFEDKNQNPGEWAEIPINLTIEQVKSADSCTAKFETLDDQQTATFNTTGLPKNKSVELSYENSDGYLGVFEGKTDEIGNLEITDTYNKDNEEKWYCGLGDMEIEEGDTYTLDIYETSFEDGASVPTCTCKITRHPVEFVFDSRPEQNMSWNGDDVTAIYGDGTASGKTASVTEEDGGMITYASSDTDVAEVNSSTGALTILGAGEVTITATAADVPAKYRQTSISYSLTINKKEINITADSKTKMFGESNPELTFTVQGGPLVGDDTDDVLGITLSSTATKTSPVNDIGYPITGACNSDNYTVTVAEGTLTVTKADAPKVSDISENLLYSEEHSNVTVQIAGLPNDRGTTAFGVGNVTDANMILKDITPTVSGIKFSTNKLDTAGKTATIPVTVTMQNYKDVTVNVNVNLVDKTPVTITGVSVSGKTYDGNAVSYTGTPSNEQGYTGSYEYVWAVKDGETLLEAPKDAGTYTLTVNVPKDDVTYMGETTPIEFTIQPKELTVKPKDVTIYNSAALPTTFTLEYDGMVNGDTITPENTPEFTLKNGNDTLSDSKTNGTYSIAWTNKDAVTVADGNYNITKSDGTLTITSRPSHGGSGSSSSSTPTTITFGGTIKTTVAAKTNKNGEAKTSVSSNTVNGAMKKALADAQSSGKLPRLEIHVDATSDASAVETTLPKTAIQSVVDHDLISLTLSNPVASLNFDSEALKTIANEIDGEVTVSASQVSDSKLSDAASRIVGERPVYDFSVKSGKTTISHFDGTVTISMPYTPADGENTNAIVAYYINADGQPDLMQNCNYDTEAGALVFTTTHFSTYAVGYNNISFRDVSDRDWYADAVSFIAARNITGGTSETTFSPDNTLTRGQFMTLLMRAYDIEPDANRFDNFSDAGNTYYTGYLAAAKRLGISNGVGNNKFAPEQAVSRQQMFTLLYNALKVVDELPESDSGKNLSHFTDNGSVASYAQEAMTYLVKAGTVSGNNGYLQPEATTTRAQMAQVLYNLLSK